MLLLWWWHRLPAHVVVVINHVLLHCRQAICVGGQMSACHSRSRCRFAFFGGFQLDLLVRLT